MDWNTVPIEERDPDHPDAPAPDAPPATAGLVVRPEALHEHFLGELDHLEEAISLHQAVVYEHAKDIEARFEMVAGVLRSDAFLDLFGGREKDGALVIPLHGCELSGVDLSMGEMDGRVVFRLQLAIEGGQHLERLFTLPADCNLADATWAVGELHLNLDRSRS